jgi:hypothetical protein
MNDSSSSSELPPLIMGGTADEILGLMQPGEAIVDGSFSSELSAWPMFSRPPAVEGPPAA